MATNHEDYSIAEERAKSVLKTIENYGLIREATKLDLKNTAFMDPYFILSSSMSSSSPPSPASVPG
jgi:hypothetical protein